MKRKGRWIAGVIGIGIILITANLYAIPTYWESDYGTPVVRGDDNYVWDTIGFNFNFYGTSYGSLFITTNGVLSFTNYALRSYSEIPLPNSWNRFISPIWDDFNPRYGNPVRRNLLGSAGARRYVVTWNAPQFHVRNDVNLFQAVLYEGTNIIQFGYDRLDSNDGTVGVNRGDAVESTGFTYNGGTWAGKQRIPVGFTEGQLDQRNLFFQYNTIGGFYEISETFPTPPPIIPEPTTLFLLGTGLMGIIGWFSKKK